MKSKIKYIYIIITILALQGYSFAQLDDILNKIPNTISESVFESAITTNIKDAYPVALWLDELDKQINYKTGRKFSTNLKSGYYRFRFNTFCLHAGTYAPTEGSGYLAAPLKGAKSKLIRNIFQRYSTHTEIEQKDVQLLVWGIESGQKFGSYSTEFQMKVSPLLEAQEIAMMNLDIKETGYDLLPTEVKNVMSFYKEMRTKLSDASSSYAEIENLAVKTGTAPMGKGSRNIPSGTWSSVGNGVYIRCFPYSYQKTDVEIYIPADVYIQKDNSGNVVSIEGNNSRIELIYENKAKRFTSALIKDIITGSETKFENSRDTFAVKKSANDFIELVKKSLGKNKSKKLSKSNLNELTVLKEIEMMLAGKESSKRAYELSVDALNSAVSRTESGNTKGSSTGILSGVFDWLFAPGNTSAQRLGNSSDENGTENETDPSISENEGNNNEGNDNEGNSNEGNTSNNNEDIEKKKQEEEEKKKKEEQEKKEKCNNVIGNIYNVMQETQNSCWAAAGASMLGFKTNKAYLPDEIAALLGEEYKTIFKNDNGLPKTKLEEFTQKMGMVAEPNKIPMSEIPGILKKHGPVIILSDISEPGEDFKLHARVIYGVEGDCSINNTTFKILDPDFKTAGKYDLSFDALSSQIAKYLNHSSENKYPYILHFP